MEKKTLLRKIAENEKDRMRKLSREDFVDEYNEWFQLDEDNCMSADDDMYEEIMPKNLEVYIDNYMSYREDECEEDLKKLIKILNN